MAVIAAALAAPAIAADSLVVSETIVVTGRQEPMGASSFETRHGLDTGKIDPLRAASADEIVRRLPAVHVPVNSRGEAIAFVRNAAERQVAIFYEGADINVPWDNRLDLSLVPAALIGSVRTAAGPLAPHYGVNALSAISLSPRDSLPGSAGFGSGRRREAHVAVPLGPVLVGGSYAERAGEPLSENADLPFSQPYDDLRTNTDRELASLFGRIAGPIGAHQLSLTAFRVWGEKGIAPEGNRASGARFWRYPDVRHTLVAGRGEIRLGPKTALHAAIWYQRFGQTIDVYANAGYDRTTLRQIDRDRTLGIRQLLKHEAGALTLVASANFLESTHRQRDIAYVAGRPPPALPPALSFRQRNWSVGAELEYDFSPALRGEIGVGHDEVDYLRTGDKPSVPDARGVTGRAAMLFESGGGLRFRAGIGSKMRAPTLRERFGEAINRFLPNPGLKPERILTVEVAAEWHGNKAEFFLIPFIQDIDNTIDQRNVGTLRQRINLAGSKVIGLETGGEWRPLSGLSVSGHAVWTRVRRKDGPAGSVNRLAEKPSLLARLSLDYVHPTGLSTTTSINSVGRAFSANPAGALVPLTRSTSIDWELGYAFNLRRNSARVFLHFENLTDSLIEPQLGLPAPGRSIRFGVVFG